MIEYLSNIPLGWLYYTLSAAYALTVVVIIVVILSENRSPVKSLAWVTVLLLLPLLGIVLYVFFGRSIKNTRMISRRNRRRLRGKNEWARRRNIDALRLSAESKSLLKLTRNLAGEAIYDADSIEVYTDGQSKFDALLRDISQASRYINLQYYIIEDDPMGQRVKDALIERARSGVTVRLIYDNVGSFKVKRHYFDELKEAGVQVYPFFNVVFPPFGTRINWRNHRKISIIDGEIGYIGGMNLAQRYVDGGKKFACWRDTHIRFTGPAVRSLQYSFALDWNFMGQPLIEDEPPTPPHERRHGETCVMQLLTSGPTLQWNNVAMLFVRAIASAKRRLYIQTPYFLPTEALFKAMQTAALSGVDVRVMIPWRSDSRMLDYASASYITECLQSGIKIYMYTAGMLHAKVLIMDDELVSIGSTNFDFRSFEHNFEANMQVYSREFNARMTQIFIDDLAQCRRVDPAEWRGRPRSAKIAESVIRLLSPVL